MGPDRHLDLDPCPAAHRESCCPATSPRLVLTEGRAATCEMIILELASGTRTEEEYRELCEDVGALQQFPIIQSVWRSAYRIAHTLQRKGLSIPAADQLIAAVVIHYSCSLLHSDKHFDLLA